MIMNKTLINNHIHDNYINNYANIKKIALISHSHIFEYIIFLAIYLIILIIINFLEHFLTITHLIYI